MVVEEQALEKLDESSSDSGFESGSGKVTLESRRIIITHLPKSTSLAQVLKVIRGRDAITSADIYDTPKIANIGDRLAVVEFAESATAKLNVSYARHHEVTVLDQEGTSHQITIQLAKTSTSTPLSPDCPLPHKISRGLCWRNNGMTRTLKVTDFPVKATWFCLCTLGLNTMLTVEYDYEKSALCIEFASMFYARRASQILNEGWFPYCPPSRMRFVNGVGPQVSFEPDSTNSNSDDSKPFMGKVSAAVEYIPANHVEKRFDRPPFNQLWPETRFPIMSLNGLEPRPYRDTMLQALERHVYLNRHTWSWDIPEEHRGGHDEMMKTLGDPLWEDA